jgi:two-component system, NarL family, nitrate/nitrite response regulator NarL
MIAPEHIANEGGPIRVLLVDDHQHVLWGLGKLIDGEWPRMAVAGTASTVSEALRAMSARRTDVVVLDVYLGEENSLDRLEELKRGGAAVVVLTGAPDRELRRRAIEGGACALVLKEEPAEVLLREIERAHERRRVEGAAA